MRVQVPITKPQPWVLPVTVVCLALGILLALMFKLSTPADNAPPNMPPEEQARFYKTKSDEMQTEIGKLQIDIGKLQNERNEYIDESTKYSNTQKVLQDELDDLRIRSGKTGVEGPGIVITLDDAKKPVTPEMNPGNAGNALLQDVNLLHDVDLLMVVNELRCAGAEAIAINGQRVVGSTAIRCVGTVVHINDLPVSAPFIIQAIGKAQVLDSGMNLPGGELDSLRGYGFRVELVEKKNMRVPAVITTPQLQVGKVVKDDKETDSAK